MRFLSSIMMVLFLLSCSHEPDTISLKEVNIKIDRAEYIESLNSLVDDQEFIQLQDVPGVENLEITDILISNQYIFIPSFYNNGELYIFDRAGKYLNKVSAQGKGKGKYLQAIDFYYDEEASAIVVGDNGYKKMMLFDLDGSFVAEKKIDFHFIKFSQIVDITGKMNYVFFTPQPNNGLSQFDKQKIIFTDDKFNIVNGLFPKSELEQKWNYSPNNKMFKSNGATFFSPAYTGAIHHIKDVGTTDVLLEIENNKKNVESKVTNVINENPSIQKLYELDDFVPFNKFIVNSSHIYARTKRHNLYHQLFIDRVNSKAVIIPMSYNLENMTAFPMYPLGSYQDYFVSAINLQTFRDITKNSDFPEFHGKNPVLVFQKLKQF